MPENTGYHIIPLERREDPRGFLFEVLRFMDHHVPGSGQIYVFSINPGFRRGDHYHDHKEEWFTCVAGRAMVLMTTSDGKNASVELCADQPQTIHVYAGTTHALINSSKETAIIVSYGSHQHDPENPDTFTKTACQSDV